MPQMRERERERERERRAGDQYATNERKRESEREEQEISMSQMNSAKKAFYILHEVCSVADC